jgi:hypothetical protein
MSILSRLQKLEQATLPKQGTRRIDDGTHNIIGGANGFLRVPKPISLGEWVAEVNKIRTGGQI